MIQASGRALKKSAGRLRIGIGIGIGALCLMAAAGSFAVAAEGRPGKMVRVGGIRQIEGLIWKTESEIPLAVETVQGARRWVAVMQGRYDREDWSLSLGTRQIKRTKRGEFIVKFPVRGKDRPLDLIAVGPNGQAQREKFYLVFSKSPGSGKRLSLFPSIGVTLVNYAETDVNTFQETAMTAKASLRYLLVPPNWDFAITAFGTVANLHSSDPDLRAKFLGINFRIGYMTPWLREPWRFGIMVGTYYTTMFVTDNAFGIKDLMGPQVFPTLRHTLRNGDSISAYIKYSPVAQSFSLLTLSNREAAFGSAWTSIMKNGHPFSASADFSNLYMTLNDAVRGDVKVNFSTFSFSLGYGF